MKPSRWARDGRCVLCAVYCNLPTYSLATPQKQRITTFASRTAFLCRLLIFWSETQRLWIAGVRHDRKIPAVPAWAALYTARWTPSFRMKEPKYWYNRRFTKRKEVGKWYTLWSGNIALLQSISLQLQLSCGHLLTSKLLRVFMFFSALGVRIPLYCASTCFVLKIFNPVLPQIRHMSIHRTPHLNSVCAAFSSTKSAT